jgi:hypothetical protein
VGRLRRRRLPRRGRRRSRRSDGRRIRSDHRQTRFTALASGEVDMLARNTTWTFSRDVDLAFEFVGVNYYDGQGFMVPREELGVSLGQGTRRRHRLHPDRHHDRAEPRGLLPRRTT